MSKLCSQCEKENPNSANVCMFCGTRFIENAETDKMYALHRELSEAKDTIKVLKDALKEKKQKKELEKDAIKKNLESDINELVVKSYNDSKHKRFYVASAVFIIIFSIVLILIIIGVL